MCNTLCAAPHVDPPGFLLFFFLILLFLLFFFIIITIINFEIENKKSKTNIIHKSLENTAVGFPRLFFSERDFAATTFGVYNHIHAYKTRMVAKL